MLKTIKKQRVSDLAVEQISQMLSAEQMKPGDSLPSERSLMEQLGISRVAVREALRVLEMMGLIEVKPGKGIFVAHPDHSIFGPFEQWLSVHQEALLEHFEVRMLIEPHAAGFCAQRASKDQIRAMKKTLEKFKQANKQEDLVAMIRADAQLHQLIAVATGNRTLATLMDTFTGSLLEGWKASLRVEGRSDKTVLEHAAIVEAIERRDSDKAQTLMRKHLGNAVHELKKVGLTKRGM
ncbi:MAG: FadR/GntR family transcriptional regulator [Thermodesulfobacteriota bacterium]